MKFQSTRTSCRSFLNVQQCFLAPTKQQFKTFRKIMGCTMVQRNCTFQNSAILSAQQGLEFCLGCNICSLSQVINRLQNIENTFICAGQVRHVPVIFRMNISMANLMIQIVDTQFCKISDITFCIRRHQFPQTSIIVFCAMKQIPDFKWVPICKIRFAANKTAWQIKPFQGPDDFPLLQQIFRAQSIDHNHNVEITAICCFPAEIAALQTNIRQSGWKLVSQQENQLREIHFYVKHQMNILSRWSHNAVYIQSNVWNASFACFKISGIGILCGQYPAHFPQLIHSVDFTPVHTSVPSWR